MSRMGSITTACSPLASTKLAFPSSDARTPSTEYTALEGKRRGRQEDVDGQQRDRDRAAVEHRLRRNCARGAHAEVDQEVAQAVREMEERHRDQDEQVELHDRVAEDRDVVRLDDVDDAEWTEDALEDDVHRQQHGGENAALG